MHDSQFNDYTVSDPESNPVRFEIKRGSPKDFFPHTWENPPGEFLQFASDVVFFRGEGRSPRRAMYLDYIFR